jgi:uncharacterized protein (DUF433 family)
MPQVFPSLTLAWLGLALVARRNGRSGHSSRFVRAVLAGVFQHSAVIKGTRLTVQYILGLLGQGATVDEILQEYDGLTQDDILACLLFATEALDNTSFVPLTSEAA